MSIIDCPNCGGTHYGSNRCPYIKAPCVVCGAETIQACSDCAISFGGKKSVHVCEKLECQMAHERDHQPAKDDAERRTCQTEIQKIIERHRLMIDEECKPFIKRLERLPQPTQTVILADGSAYTFKPGPRG